MDLTSEIFPHRILERIIQIATMLLITTAFWVVCILFLLKFPMFGVAGLAFAAISALAAGMIGAFHGVFFIPYDPEQERSNVRKERSKVTRPLLLLVRLKWRLGAFWKRLLHTPLKQRLISFATRLFHMSLGCVAGFICLFLYGLLIFVVLLFVNEYFTISTLGVPSYTYGLIFGFLFGTLAGAIWRGFIHYPPKRVGIHHRGIREFFSNSKKFSGKLTSVFGRLSLRKTYLWLTRPMAVNYGVNLRTAGEEKEPSPEKVMLRPPILHPRDALMGVILCSIVILPYFLFFFIAPLLDLQRQGISSSSRQLDVAFLILGPLELIILALVGGFAAGISKYIHWLATGTLDKKLFIKIGALLTFFGFLLTLVGPSISLLQSVSASTVLSSGLGSVSAIAWSPDSTRIAIAGSNEVQVWDIVAQKLLTSYSDSTGMTTVAWSPDGRYIAAGGGAGIVGVWDTQSSSSKPVRIFEGKSSDVVNAVAWLPDGTRIAAGEDSGLIQIWEAAQSNYLIKTYKPSLDISSVAWSPDSTRIVTGFFSDSSVQIWNTTSSFDHPIRTYSGHSSAVASVACSPDGTRIVSGSFDKTVQVWYVQTGDLIRTLPDSNGVYAVAWSPDGTRVAAGDDNGYVNIWKV